MILRKMVHIKCRNNTYPFSAMKRLHFSDDQVPWDVDFKEYDPPEYNSKALIGKLWADPQIGKSLCYLNFVLGQMGLNPIVAYVGFPLTM